MLEERNTCKVQPRPKQIPNHLQNVSTDNAPGIFRSHTYETALAKVMLARCPCHLKDEQLIEAEATFPQFGGDAHINIGLGCPAPLFCIRISTEIL